jgi:hypothetical protein
MPEIIRAESTADFLAMVPGLAGFSPQNSLVCVPFAGRRTVPGLLRIDLPERRRKADYRKIVSYVVGVLSRMPGIDRVDPVIYTDSGFASERGIPWVGLGRALIDGLVNAGFHIGQAACVASDGWGSYLEAAHRAEGHPLSEIASSDIGARMAEARGGPVGGVLDDVEMVDAAEDERAEIARLIEVIREEVRRQDGSVIESLDAKAELDPVSWLEYCLERVDALDDADRAMLLLFAESPPVRDQFAVQVAFGRAVGQSVMIDNLLYNARRQATGRSMDELVADDLAAGERPFVDAGSLLLGRTATRPDVARVTSGIRLFHDAIAVAPDDLRPSALCVLAWLHWSLGRGSAAGYLIDRALDLDPDHGMAAILATIFDAGMIPEWAFAREDEDAETL